MIDLTTLTKADVGKLVRYTAPHGATETGLIRGWNHKYISVLYYGGSEAAKATSPQDLEFVETAPHPSVH
jgi:hypothetical protein